MSLIIYEGIHMTNDRNKFLVMAILVTAFLSFSFFLYSALPVKSGQENKEADTGKLAWQKYNCNACHQVYGLGGFLGPDLTNVYSKKGEGYIHAFLKSGTTIMPDYHLSQQEIKDLTSFLKTIDASGSADPKTFTINYDGSIEQ